MKNEAFDFAAAVLLFAELDERLPSVIRGKAV